MSLSPCPTPHELESLVNELVTADEEASLGRHLEACAPCRQELEEISGTKQLGELAPEIKQHVAKPSARLREVMRKLQASQPDEQPADSAETVESFVLDSLEPSDDSSLLGRMGHYDVVRVIGRGGMGVVLQAFDSKLNRPVALKVISPLLAVDSSFRQRFVREGQAAAAINHSNVITIFAIEEGGMLPYLVMEFVEGESIAERIQRQGPLTVAEIVRIGVQMSLGLHAAHRHGVIHRDIKPSNILLEAGTGCVKLTDFGLAQLEQQADLTRTGMLLGTPEYMAPEQARGEAADQRTDLYSLGSVLYAMCHGQAPFQGGSTFAVLARVARADPLTLQDGRADLPPWLVQIIERLHAADPQQRFRAADEVAGALRQQGQAGQFPPPPPVQVSAPPRQVAAERPLPTETVAVQVHWPDTLAVRRPVRPTVKDNKFWALALGSVVLGVIVIASMYGMYGGGNSAGPIEVARQPSPPGVRPFVVRGPRAETAFATLEEAIAAAQGQPIEIRVNGPVAISTLRIKQPTHLRAPRGFLPALQLRQDHVSGNAPLIEANAPLLLEGIELWVNDKSPHPGEMRPCLRASSHALAAVNCRFVLQPGNLNQTAIFADRLNQCVLRNCQFVGGTAIDWNGAPQANLLVENCVVLADTFLMLSHSPYPRPGNVALVDNTIGTINGFRVGLDGLMDPRPQAAVNRFFVERNILHTQDSLLWLEGPPQLNRQVSPAIYIDRQLRRVMDWVGHDNAYAIGQTFLAHNNRRQRVYRDMPSLPDWRKYWNDTEANSLPFAVKPDFSIAVSAVTDPAQANQFAWRLARYLPPKSAGLGAYLKHVGPGQPCDAWRNSPDYFEQFARIRDTIFFVPQPNGE